MAEINYEHVDNAIQTFVLYQMAVTEESMTRVKILCYVYHHWLERLNSAETSLFIEATNQLYCKLSYRRKSG